MKLNHAQGQAGEDCALAFLQKQGCEPVARNWHCRAGEIDLVVRQGELLLFVEVRYRKSKRFGGAAYSITPPSFKNCSVPPNTICNSIRTAVRAA